MVVTIAVSPSGTSGRSDRIGPRSVTVSARDLRRGEAIRPVGAGFASRKIARGLEIAAARIVNQAVLDSVETTERWMRDLEHEQPVVT